MFIQFIKHFSNVPILNDIKAEDMEDYTNRFIPIFLEEKDTDSIKVVKIKEDIFEVKYCDALYMLGPGNGAIRCD